MAGECESLDLATVFTRMGRYPVIVAGRDGTGDVAVQVYGFNISRRNRRWLERATRDQAARFAIQKIAEARIDAITTDGWTFP